MRYLTVNDDSDVAVVVLTSYEVVSPAVIITTRRGQAIAIRGDELADLRLLLQVGDKMLSSLTWPQPGQAA